MVGVGRVEGWVVVVVVVSVGGGGGVVVVVVVGRGCAVLARCRKNTRPTATPKRDV